MCGTVAYCSVAMLPVSAVVTALQCQKAEQITTDVSSETSFEQAQVGYACQNKVLVLQHPAQASVSKRKPRHPNLHLGAVSRLAWVGVSCGA